MTGANNYADAFQQQQLAAYLETIQPQILASLVTARVNPDLPFGDLFPWRIDWILQDVIDWVATTGQRLGELTSYWWNRLTSFLTNIWDWILQQATNAINTWWNNIRSFFENIWTYVNNIWNKVYTLGSEILAGISNTIAGFINTLTTNIGSFFNNLPGTISNIINNVWTWINTAVSNITQTVGGWVQGLLPAVSGFFSTLWQNIMAWFNNLMISLQQWIASIGPLLDNLGRQILDIPGKVVAGLGDFASGLWKTVQGWFTQDAHDSLANLEKESPWPVPEHGSPFFETVFRGFVQATINTGTAAVKPGVTMAFGPGTIADEIADIIFPWIGGFFGAPIKWMMDFFTGGANIAPNAGTDIMPVINNVLGRMLSGLTAMMVTGELVKEWAHLGMGHIAAILYDMTNFKDLTGSFIKTFTSIYIAKPLQYYYEEKSRPNLPGVGDMIRMAGEYQFIDHSYADQFNVGSSAYKMIDDNNLNGFRASMRWHGIPDEWIDRLYDVSKRPATYFSLRAMADAGIYDEGYFIQELLHNGFKLDTVPMMLDMLRRYSEGDVKTIMVGAATTKYKYGLSSEEDLRTELKSLAVQDNKIDKYVFAANLNYQVDYAADLITAYRTQYSKGMIDEATFRDNLLTIGIVPERVETYVLTENAKLLKAPPKIKTGVTVPDYLTDSGQLQVQTARDAFRKDLTTSTELYANLVKLQMPADLAEAYVQAEIIKKTPVATPQYLTDDGALQVTTAKAAFEKGTITDADLRSKLTALEMPPDMVEAVVQYEKTKVTPSRTPYYLTDEGAVKVNSAKEAFRKNLITDVDLGSELTQLEMPRDLVEAVVQYEVTKATPKAV